MAASLTAYIRKGQPAEYGHPDASSAMLAPGGDQDYRDLRMVPGLIMDDLLPGEDIGIIDSKRPNPNAADFREGQLRAVSRGVGTTFSSLAGNYNGTYSAQRQELIEQWAAYAVLGEWFIAQCVRPMWRRFVQSAYMAGLIKLPRGWRDLTYLSAATFIRPSMPWINPMHEVQALKIQEEQLWLPTSEIIRRRGGEPRDVLVHWKECRGVDQGDEAAAWFADLLGRECRLVRFAGRRETSRGGGVVQYADGYPLLLISKESLDDLNGRLAEPLPMNRFRPSLVVEGLGAFGEDGARLLRIGGTLIEAIKPCTRCVITTTDQETGERGREPLRTLAAYRSGEGGLLFGQNCVPRTVGTLAVGDPVEIVESR